MKTLTTWFMALVWLACATIAATSLPATAASPLSAAETADLQFMREEEKLAHDVYVALHAKWGTQVFLNISQSEATHTASIKTLLDRYGIADPVVGKKVGEFADPKLAALYQQLLKDGSTSQAAALKVGQAIEELDIKDLDERIARTSNADIKAVYANLRRGSENHLRAFTGQGARR